MWRSVAVSPAYRLPMAPPIFFELKYLEHDLILATAVFAVRFAIGIGAATLSPALRAAWIKHTGKRASLMLRI